ncbi:MAG: hypothetical protein ACKPDM_18925, partial [Dolichospermum sp.]
ILDILILTITISLSYQQLTNHNPVNPKILDILIQTITISPSHQQPTNYQGTIQTVGWVEHSETQQINHHLYYCESFGFSQLKVKDERSH